MDEELKNIFDDITKRIAEEEDNALAKAFTMYIGDCLRREGIVPILTKVEMPYEECSTKNEYQIVSRYGYMFERLDTSAHDKQIRDEILDNVQVEVSEKIEKQIREEVIEELLNKLEYRFFDDGLWECVTKEDVYEIAEQMKGGAE